MFGLAMLLLIGLALVLAAGTLAVLRGISRPPRKTYGRALAKDQPTDPAELGRSAEPVTFRFDDGQTSPGWIVAGDQPDGPTVIVLHGFGDSRYGALTRLDRLAPHARRMVVYDQRGHGEASAPRSTGGMIEQHDVLSAIDQLGEDEPVVLFGYSLGAQMAIAAAARAARGGAARIGGVIAEGPYRRWRTPVAAMMRCHRLPAEPVLTLVAGLIRLGVGAEACFDRATDAAAMGCPLLVLHGRVDPICPLAEARAIADAAADGELVVIEAGGHLDLTTVAPERYQRALDRFFQKLAAQPSRTTEKKQHAADYAPANPASDRG
jgi:pimeloyl-ACP methyl ester carboxylesterase